MLSGSEDSTTAAYSCHVLCDQDTQYTLRTAWHWVSGTQEVPLAQLWHPTSVPASSPAAHTQVTNFIFLCSSKIHRLKAQSPQILFELKKVWKPWLRILCCYLDARYLICHRLQLYIQSYRKTLSKHTHKAQTRFDLCSSACFCFLTLSCSYLVFKSYLK